ncbi:GPP34 family phosphoprotein [Catellatospora sp. NPDC049609]|uniref:GOLPH3/VPS74 family protein n=1 Tax=Catellatospora sp. NPDC049609 TaxID=3155505 RepID=UPI0034212AC4
MAGLALADELFQMGHDEYSGKVRVSVDMLGCGLAAAALGELLLAGTLSVQDGKLAGWTARQTGDPVTDQVVAQLQRVGAGHALHHWVAHLRPEITELVAYRMAGKGVIRRETSRSFTGRVQTRFPASDPTEATRSAVRLGFLLGRPSDFDPQSALLAMLATGVGLDIVAPSLSGGQVRDRLALLQRSLPADHRDLIRAVDTAVAAIALQSHA